MSGAYATANGSTVLTAHLVRPRVGAWHADLDVDVAAADAFAGAVTISLGGLTFQGYARRAGAERNIVSVRVVGGAGGLARQVPPRSWQSVPLRIPLADCLAAVGETLSSSCDAGTLGTLLPRWSRPSRSAGQEIAALVAAVPGAVWRVLPDGTTWVGPETWPTASFAYTAILFEPELARLEFYSDAPSIGPGQVFRGAGEPYAGRKVSTVEHVADADQIRHFIFFEDASGGLTDRLKAGLTALIQSIVGPRLDALASYPARVVAQNGDGTLELIPDDPRWPPYSKVPIRYGVPGVAATVAPGARVMLGFAAGDARKPIAELWESASVTQLTVTATSVKIGAAAADALVRGTTYRTAEDTLLAAIIAAMGTIPTGGAAAAAQATTALNAFQLAAASYLSTTGKTA